jgi:hypothetical protein
VLDVGDRCADCADDGRVERPPRGCEQEKGRDAARRLEAARVEIVVWDTVSGGVGDETEAQRAGA